MTEALAPYGGGTLNDHPAQQQRWIPRTALGVLHEDSMEEKDIGPEASSVALLEV